MFIFLSNNIIIRAILHVMPTRSHRLKVSASLSAIIFLFGFTAPFTQMVSITHGGSSAVYHGRPNTYHLPKAPDRSGPYPGPKPVIQPAPNPKNDTHLYHHFKPSMKPLHVSLVAQSTHRLPGITSVAVDVTSSDGLLEIRVPVGAVSAADIAAAGGAIYLQVDQVAPPSGTTDGAAGTGLMSFGTYTFQLQDASGNELASGQGLRQPLTLVYHLTSAPVDLTTTPVFFDVNGSLPVILPHPLHHIGKPQTVKAAYDHNAKTLTGIVPMAASGGSGGLTANAPVGYFTKPNAFQNDLHTGSLTDSLAIDVPAGPGGLTPPFNLSYSSESVSQSHGAQATASWVGMGWSLDPGEITWSETNVAASSPAQWGNSWSISDPFGTSGTLIPPHTTTNPWYSDLSTTLTAQPIVWHTDPESHAKIVSFKRQGSMPYHFPSGFTPPCYRMWLPNGVMEEFGCVGNSLQWYMAGTSSQYPYITAWKLDLITDPSGNQIHFDYNEDDTPTGLGTYNIRDLVPADAQWDAPGCHNANSICTTNGGTNLLWNPLYQVTFAIDQNHNPRLAPGQTTCTRPNSSKTYLRCDDPMLPSGVTGIDTPTETNTEVLNDIFVQVRTSTTDTWHQLHDYQLAYEQSALSPSYIIEPFGGKNEAAAGYLLLDQITEYGTDSTTHYPTQTFGYTYPATQYYEDSNAFPNSGAGCGPVWNTGKFANGSTNGCLMWYRDYNGYYMSTADNGQGLHQTFSYTNFRTNMHGVDSGQNAKDPGYCTRAETNNGSATGYPCDMPDDNGWSHITLTGRTGTVNTPTTANPSQQQQAIWSYVYNLTALTAQMCADCTVGMYGGNANDGNAQGFYDGKFVGFGFAEVSNPDGSLENDYYDTTLGWGVWDNTQVTCINAIPPSPACPTAPSWNLTNAATGHVTETDSYNPKVNGVYPLEKKVTTTWQATCPPAQVAGSGSNGTYSWAGNLVSEVDLDNPEAACDVQQASQTTYLADGNGSPTTSTVPYTTVTDTYDTTNAYGHLTQSQTEGADLAPTNPIVNKTTFIWNDSITTSSTGATGTYIVDRAAFNDTEDNAGHMKACAYHYFDGMTYHTSQQPGLTSGLETQTDTVANCGVSGTVTAKTGYNNYGDKIWTLDADANAGVSGHTGCTINSVAYTTCTTYDSIYNALPTSSANALNQTSTTSYDTSQGYGYGLWPKTTTDPNGQVTTAVYDSLGRVTATTLPLEGTGLTTKTLAYSYAACASSPSAPCLEVDTTQRLDSSHTIQSEDFYDGWGRHVETRKPSPSGQDVVQYLVYDTMGRVSFQSQPYFIASGTAAGYVTPDYPTQPGTTYVYDGLGRAISMTDPLSAVTTTAYAAQCSVSGTGDSNCYEATTTIDANSHKQASYTDALGHTRYSQGWTGNSANTYALYRTTIAQYDYLGDMISTTYADGTHQATATFNMLGQMTDTTDPDLGTYHYTYDANGNQLSAVDPRGSSGTVYVCYNGLNRPTAKSSTSSTCANPFATETYDSTANGNVGIGRLTSETFTSNGVSGSYAYTYDARGRQTGWSMTLGSTYSFSIGYNDADQQTSLTYPDGDVVTTGFDLNSGWLNGATEVFNGTTNLLLSNPSYSGVGGASQKITSANAGPYSATWSYDNNLRLTETNISYSTNIGGHFIVVGAFDQQRGFDAVGNVVTANTTLQAGTDNQAFCYDEFNRLTWAGSTGTPTCGGSLTTGNLTSANYTQSYAYDTLNRLTSGPRGAGYTYGDTNHLDAVTSAPSYSASYDAAGNMITRNNQSISYDAAHRLTHWQNTVSNPTSTADYAYSGSGERVQQQAATTSNGVTTTVTTNYIGAYEEVATSLQTGSCNPCLSATTTTKYYQAGPVTAESQNGTLYYLVNDGLGSVSVVLTNAKSVQASQLFLPFGASRYSNGTMPTSFGFTNQRQDPSGLNYDHARYYDPSAGQFVVADLVQGPNRYAYVGGNPETLTDPTGNHIGGPVCVDCGTNPAPPSNPQVQACLLQHHCVIFIDGPNVPGDPWNCLKCEPDNKTAWKAWESEYEQKYGSSKVSFIFLDAPDANNGADNINTTLNELQTGGYSGSVTLVGHSNGAAAIYHYFAQAQRGYYTGGYAVSSFVALDAPAPNTFCDACTALETGWSQWVPGLDTGDAAAYVKHNGIQGVNAYDDYDSLSGDIGNGNGAWQVYHSSGSGENWFSHFNLVGPHLRLEYSPDNTLLDLLGLPTS